MRKLFALVIAAITSAIIILACALWRWVDGRYWGPSRWNVVFFLGYGFACSMLPYEIYVQVIVFALGAINILSGFDSFTLPWLGFRIDMAKLVMEYHNKQALFDSWPNLKKQVDIEYVTRANALKLAFEAKYGFNTWHTCYRFLLPVLITCAFTQWDWAWVILTIHAGALFPLTEFLKVPFREHIREAYLGLIILGGPFFQVTLNVWEFLK